MQYEFRAVCRNKKKVGVVAARDGSSFGPVQWASGEQHRDWSSESRQANGCGHGGVRYSAGTAVKGTSSTFDLHSERRAKDNEAAWPVSRRKYAEATKLEIDSTSVRLISVVDESEGAARRSAEVVELVAELLRLATKRGRVKRQMEEVQDEAA